MVLTKRGSVSSSEDPARGSLSHRLKLANKLFDLLSSRSEIDHPLCQGCADDLKLKIEKQLSEVKKEHELYAAYQPEPDTTNHDEEIESLKIKEQQVFNLLMDLEKENQDLEIELQALELEKLHEEQKKLEQVVLMICWTVLTSIGFVRKSMIKWHRC